MVSISGPSSMDLATASGTYTWTASGVSDTAEWEVSNDPDGICGDYTTTATQFQLTSYRGSLSKASTSFTLKVVDGSSSATKTVTVTDSSYEPDPDPITVTSLSMSGSYTVEVGSTVSIPVKYTPTNANKFTWVYSNSFSNSNLSFNNSIQSVSNGSATLRINPIAKGTLPASLSGTFTLTCNGHSASISLTVKNTEAVSQVSSITISGSTSVREQTTSQYYSCSVYPTTATDRTVSWSVSGPASITSVASSTRACYLSFGSPGTVVLTATANDGSGVSDTHVITVTEYNYTSSVSMSQSSLSFMEGETATIYAYRSPSDADNSWYLTADNLTIGDVAYFSYSGVKESNSTYRITLTANKEYTGGYVQVYAYNSSGTKITANCYITVTPAPHPVTGITLDGASVPTYLKVGDSTSVITPRSQPTNADIRTLSAYMYTGSDNASVEAYRTTTDGCSFYVTGRAVGDATVRIAAMDDSGVYMDLDFIVVSKYPAQNFQIAPKRLYVDVETTLSCRGMGEEEADFEIIAGTGSAEIVRVYSQTYVTVKGLSAGTVTIRGVTRDTGAVATTELTIYDEWPSESRNQYDFYVGDQYRPFLTSGTGDSLYGYTLHGGRYEVTLPEGLGIALQSGQYESVFPKYGSSTLSAGSFIGGELADEAVTATSRYIVYAHKPGSDAYSDNHMLIIVAHPAGEWTKTIHFDPNLQTGMKLNEEVPKDIVNDKSNDEQAFEVKDCQISADGWTFCGWYNDDKELCTSQYITGRSDRIKVLKAEDATLTLTALWVKNVEGAVVTYNNLSVTASDTIGSVRVSLIQNITASLVIPNMDECNDELIGPLTVDAVTGSISGMSWTYGGSSVTLDGLTISGGKALVLSGAPVNTGNMTFRTTDKNGVHFTYTIVSVGSASAKPVLALTGESDMVIGSSITLTALVTPANLAIKDVVWAVESGSERVDISSTQVTSTGGTCIVRGIGVGPAVISATSVLDPTVKKTVAITVHENEDIPEAPEDLPNCWLNVTTPIGSKTLRLQTVTQINDTYTATLTEIPTVVYGYAERFITDMGTSEKLTVKVERDNPIDYDDSSDDEMKWSNGRWYHELEDMLDFWQNFGRDMQTRAWVGGLRFYFAPPKDAEELFPIIDRNVFMAGSINISHSVQKLSLTLPLQVGRMTASGSTASSVTVRFQSMTDSETVEFTRQYPENAMQTLPLPDSSWDQHFASYLFAYWAKTPSEVDSERRYYAGDVVRPEDNPSNIWYARWTEPIEGSVIITAAGEGTITVPTGATRMQVYAVGGGGSGGRGMQSGVIARRTSTGGGGAGGQVVRYQCAVAEGDVYGYSVGRGGEEVDINSVVTSSRSGHSGYSTGLTTSSKDILVVAKGGDGGDAGVSWDVGHLAPDPSPAKGGQTYYAGGASGEGWTGRGEDGADPLGIGAGGKGAVGKTNTTSLGENRHQGGGGGGASAFDMSFRLSGETSPTRYTSKGGDGASDSAASAGVYGGGGGSAAVDHTGAGGDGFLAVLFY